MKLAMQNCICFCLQIKGPAFNYTNVELQFWIRLHRRSIFYVMNIIIPIMVLANLSSLTFMVPTDSGEQLSLGVSILLAFFVFMLILSENTPQTSENPPILCKIWCLNEDIIKLKCFPFYKITGHFYNVPRLILRNKQMTQRCEEYPWWRH